MSRSTPPRVAMWVIGRASPTDRREERLGDLEELFDRHAARLGPRLAATLVLAAGCAGASRGRSRTAAPPGGAEGRFAHGDARSGSEVRGPIAGRTPFVHRAGRAHVVARHRRQRHDLQLGQCRAAGSTSGDHTARSARSVLVPISRSTPLTSVSYPDYQDIRAQSRQLVGVTVRDDLAVGIVIDAEAERAWAEIVSANYFDVLRVPMVLGRGFTAGDDEPSEAATAVLSHATGRRRFNADGRRRRAHGPHQRSAVHHRRRRCGGISRGRVRTRYDLWLPLGTQPTVMAGGSRAEMRGNRWLTLLARLAPDATHRLARAELDTIIEGMRQACAAGPLRRASRCALHARPLPHRWRRRAAAGAARADGGRRRSCC